MATKIAREDALLVLHACGFKSAGKWDNARISEKLLSIPEVAPETPPEDAKIKGLLDTVLAAAKAKDKFEVFSPEGTIETKLEDKKAAPEVKKEPSPYQRVRPSEKVAPYHCGQVFKKHGLANGVTDAMLEDYYKLRGKVNKDLAEANLCWAFGVVNGFLNGGEIAAPAEPAKDEPKAA